MKSVLVILFTFSADLLLSQNYTARHFYNQYLEPTDKIFHGAGQDENGFNDYYNIMDPENRPIIYMYYRNIYNIGTQWAGDLKKDLIKYSNNTVAIQYGLELVGSLEAIAAGNLDTDIENFLNGCAEVGLPIYLRIGYEFNGFDWNGYEPGNYKAAFVYLTNKIRERELEIATVWNFAPDGEDNFMDYYPGDDYIDWWSINIFSANDVVDNISLAFIDSAESHKKPVLIGESTPRYIGVLDGETDWNSWFVPFNNFLRSQPSIKITGYINWDWSTTRWPNWGDARLSQNQYVQDKYKLEINDSIYFHAGAEKAFRKQLGYNEDNVPKMISNIFVQDSIYPTEISWDPVNDESGIARYLIFNNDSLIDFTSNTITHFRKSENNEIFNISIAALDRAGNLSDRSKSVEVNIISISNNGEDNLIKNGDFDYGLDFWELAKFEGGQGTVSIDTALQFENKNSAKISISNSPGVNYHVQLRQPLQVSNGKHYILHYKAKADKNTTMETWIQQAAAPYGAYSFKSVSLAPEVQTYIDTGYSTKDDNAYLTFMVGNSGNVDIWIDEVCVTQNEEIVNINNNNWDQIPQYAELKNIYPNPFNPTVTIEYSLPKEGEVKLKVYNVIGEEIDSIVDNFQYPGNYSYNWDGKEESSGIYFVILNYENTNISKKICLTK